MVDDIHFNYVYALVAEWFNSEGEARQWYTNNIIPSFAMTPDRIVKDIGRAALEDWIKAKKLGGFE